MLNLIIQTILIIIILVSIYLVRNNKTKLHCRIMGFALFAQLLSTIFFMYPAMSGVRSTYYFNTFFNIELLFHHGLGLFVLLLGLYVELLFVGRVKDILNRFIAMKLIAALWFLSYLLGVHIYLVMYY